MRILITGKSSFIGNYLARHLEKSGGYQVDMLSVRGDEWKKQDFSKYDCIVHAAGKAHVGYKDEEAAEYMAVNRDLTRAVAEKAKNEGVKQFIFLSSIIIYGAAAPAGQTRVITKTTLPDPENAYGRSKLEAEEALRSIETEDFSVAILRLPMVYGRGSSGNYSLLAKYAGLLPVFPARSGRRSAIYVENLCEFIRIAADRGLRGTYYPADAESVTTPGMLRAIRGAMGKRTRLWRIFDLPVRLLAGTPVVSRIFGGIEYARELTDTDIDYRLYTLEEGVGRSIKEA